MECYNCHGLEHSQLECENEIKYAETQEEMLLMACAEMNNKTNKEDTWFFDSGYSIHICGKRECFSDFDEHFKDSVLQNNTCMSVAGKGNVRLQEDGIVQIISGVLYKPELKINLLSIGQLEGKKKASYFIKQLKKLKNKTILIENKKSWELID